MVALRFTLFGIGTVAFFVALYLAIKHPELVKSPGENKPELESHPLRKWDKLMSWAMWLGWGGAGIMYFLDRIGALEAL